MMVPRSYQYLRRPSDAGCYDEKARPTRFLKQALAPAMKKDASRRDPPRSAPAPEPVATAAADTQPPASTTEPVHSQPVVIPQPVHNSGTIAVQTVRARGQHGGRHARLSKDHRHDSLPPAVATLLAVTTIPPRPAGARRRRNPSSDKPMSIDKLIQEWRQEDRELSPSGFGSPLDLLLESVDDVQDDASIIEPSSEKEPDLLSMRSLSSDSMPSLETDEEQSLSSWSSPNTPYCSRKEKYISSPPKEDCVLDHPLLHYSLDNATEADEEAEIVIAKHVRSAPPKAKSSFKSNLTASLQALKSAAKSFSNFTAPSIPPDDLLTRSLLSPRFTSEMRPKQFQGLPTPAMRRYLNPQQVHPQQQMHSPPISPTELFKDTLQDSAHSLSSAPMIQLQTYSRTASPLPRKKRGIDPNSEAGRVLGSSPAVRQREPRENSDFLRVIVLEMNMRREGKLDAKALGKARIWLPPRKLETVEVPIPGCSAVPARWVAVGVDDV